jgi:hypothetical protein
MMTLNSAASTRLARSCMVGGIVLAFALAFAQAARASAPTTTSGSFDVQSDITTICDFSVHQTGHITFTERDYTDASGAVIRSILTVTEQDTFSAHGITLTTDAYHYTLFWEFDADGNFTKFEGDGVVARIHLPDGGLFLSAGKLSLLPDPNQFFFTPDIGRSGDVAAFCDSFTP